MLHFFADVITKCKLSVHRVYCLIWYIYTLFVTGKKIMAVYANTFRAITNAFEGVITPFNKPIIAH